MILISTYVSCVFVYIWSQCRSLCQSLCSYILSTVTPMFFLVPFFEYRQERKRYYMHRQKAVECPDEVISMIVDGMDQNKTNLPSFVRVTKACQSLWSLRTHLTGCLVHGVGAHNYFDFLQWSHDCNLTLCTLLQTLLEVAKTQPLAPRLLIQMDNCVRENKNKYVMGFFAILVQLEIFTEVMDIIELHDTKGITLVMHLLL